MCLLTSQDYFSDDKQIAAFVALQELNQYFLLIELPGVWEALLFRKCREIDSPSMHIVSKRDAPSESGLRAH